MPKIDLVTQQHGTVHGGMISYLGDTAAGLSGYTALKNADESCVTI